MMPEAPTPSFSSSTPRAAGAPRCRARERDGRAEHDRDRRRHARGDLVPVRGHRFRGGDVGPHRHRTRQRRGFAVPRVG
jgi:hypothetical protein